MDLDAMERDAAACLQIHATSKYGSTCIAESVAEHVTALVAEVRRLQALAPLPAALDRLQAAWRAELDRIEADGFVDPPPEVSPLAAGMREVDILEAINRSRWQQFRHAAPRDAREQVRLAADGLVDPPPLTEPDSCPPG